MKPLQELKIVQRSQLQTDHSFSLFGIECGDGWLSIITEALNKMDSLPDDNLYITQIKEKFGELRIYTSWYNKEIEMDLDNIIEEAEIKASTTCEICGKEGKLRPKGWIQVLCDEHEKGRTNAK